VQSQPPPQGVHAEVFRLREDARGKDSAGDRPAATPSNSASGSALVGLLAARLHRAPGSPAVNGDPARRARPLAGRLTASPLNAREEPPTPRPSVISPRATGTNADARWSPARLGPSARAPCGTHRGGDERNVERGALRILRPTCMRAGELLEDCGESDPGRKAARVIRQICVICGGKVVRHGHPSEPS
jgi:hypothetical protein